MNKYLPAHCFPDRMRDIIGALIHYFSCAIADPWNAMDPDRCWQLMHDLNLPKNLRNYGPWNGLGAGRSYGSADAFITQDGDLIELCKPGQETWHAGASAHNGKTKLNGYYKGYELIAAPQIDLKYGFTKQQYKTLAECLAQDMITYGFTIKDITGHDTVRVNWNKVCSPRKKRTVKNDPGETFNWWLLFKLINPPHDLNGG